MPDASPSAALHAARTLDRERFACALLAPVARREDLMLALAFNAETGRVRDRVREPLAGALRLQWWEEGLGGAAPGHPLLGPLALRIARGALPIEPFLSMVEARRAALDDPTPADLAALEGRIAATDGALATLVLAATGCAADAAARAAGHHLALGWGLVGTLRAVGPDRAQGWVGLPRAVLEEAGVAVEALRAGHAAPEALAAATRRLAAAARSHLDRGRALGREAGRAAAPLLAWEVAARGHLARLGRWGWNPLDPRLLDPRPRALAVLWLGLRVAARRRRLGVAGP